MCFCANATHPPFPFTCISYVYVCMRNDKNFDRSFLFYLLILYLLEREKKGNGGIYVGGQRARIRFAMIMVMRKKREREREREGKRDLSGRVCVRVFLYEVGIQMKMRNVEREKRPGLFAWYALRFICIYYKCFGSHGLVYTTQKLFSLSSFFFLLSQLFSNGISVVKVIPIRSFDVHI